MKRIYLVRDCIFHDENNAYKGKPSAIAYCKKHGIDLDEIVELYNDSELIYYRHLQEKVKQGYLISVKTHQKKTIINGFKNRRGEIIPALVVDVPFVVEGEGYTHFIALVANFTSLTRQLLQDKILFDSTFYKEGYYLRIIYQDNDGKYCDYHLNDYEAVKKEFQSAKHKELLEKQRQIREAEKFDRLKRLRDEGKITDNQRKELYRLEEIYRASDTKKN